MCSYFAEFCAACEGECDSGMKAESCSDGKSRPSTWKSNPVQWEENWIWLCRWPRRAALPTSEKLLAMHRRVKGSFLPTSDPPVALQGPINGVTQHYLVLHDGGNIWQTLNNSGTTWDEQIQPFRFSYQQTWLCFTEGKRFIYLRFSAMAASLKGREDNGGFIY